jgi:hypothetical protein
VNIAANSSTLWPPNGKMVSVTVSGTITDALSGKSQHGRVCCHR